MRLWLEREQALCKTFNTNFSKNHKTLSSPQNIIEPFNSLEISRSYTIMLGRFFFTFSAIGQIVGPFIADFNHTHVLNPNWPPHAKFHNGQTMSMGVCIGLASLYYTFRSRPDSAAAADSLFTAAIFGSLYWVTGISVILYPGSLAIDPEFGEGFPQFPLFAGLLLSSWFGWWLETKALAGRHRNKIRGLM